MDLFGEIRKFEWNLKFFCNISGTELPHQPPETLFLNSIHQVIKNEGEDVRNIANVLL